LRTDSPPRPQSEKGWSGKDRANPLKRSHVFLETGKENSMAFFLAEGIDIQAQRIILN
jgi:hypothetical protein